jgi:hypothetical protein
MERYMKKIILIASVLLSLSAFAQPLNFTCTSAEDYHNGFSSVAEFQIPLFNDVSVRSWEHDGFLINITHEADETSVSKFKLNITHNNNLLLDQDIENGSIINYESPSFSYLLHCYI